MIAPVFALLLAQAVQPAPEPPEVALFAQWVQRNLLALSMTQGGAEVRQRERVFRLQDENFAEAFTLVPEARSLALGAHEAFVTGGRFQIAGLIAVGAGAAAMVVGVLGPFAVLLPLLVVGLIGSGVGLVLTLIALPFLLTAQSKFFSAVATYDRGLLDLRPPPAQPPQPSGGLSIPLP